ncbi:hypothetical protein L9F63_013669, partial [Diploptera punctata]
TRFTISAIWSRFTLHINGILTASSSAMCSYRIFWIILSDNLLFYYDSESCNRPSGVVLLEGCYCERLITAGSGSHRSISKSRDHIPPSSRVTGAARGKNSHISLCRGMSLYSEIL